MVPEGSDRITDPQTAWLDDVLACLAEGVAGCADRSVVSDAARVDRIARLEHIKAAAAALQMLNRSGLPSHKSNSTWPLMCIRTRLAAG